MLVLRDGEFLCQTRLQLAQMANVAQTQLCQRWHMLTVVQKDMDNILFQQWHMLTVVQKDMDNMLLSALAHADSSAER